MTVAPAPPLTPPPTWDEGLTGDGLPQGARRRPNDGGSVGRPGYLAA